MLCTDPNCARAKPGAGAQDEDHLEPYVTAPAETGAQNADTTDTPERHEELNPWDRMERAGQRCELTGEPIGLALSGLTRESLGLDPVTEAQQATQAWWALSFWGETHPATPWGRARTFFTYNQGRIFSQQATRFVMEVPGDQRGAAMSLLQQDAESSEGIGGFVRQSWNSPQSTTLTHALGGTLELIFPAGKRVAPEWDLTNYLQQQGEPTIWRRFSPGEATLLGGLLPRLTALTRTEPSSALHRDVVSLPFQLTERGAGSWELSYRRFWATEPLPPHVEQAIRYLFTGPSLQPHQASHEVTDDHFAMECRGARLFWRTTS